MNNALSFVNTLLGTSITFKPSDRLRDRPVQTMTFNALNRDQYGLVVETTISYTTKNSTTPTTVHRILSLTRVMQYIAEASEQTYMDVDPQPAESSTIEVDIIEIAEDVVSEVEPDPSVAPTTVPQVVSKKKKKGNR